MIIAGIKCVPEIDVFVSSDNERHIIELSWWPEDDELAGKTGALLRWRHDFHWDDTAKIRDSLIEALARIEKRSPS